MTERFITALFCDDIREEVGNKVSLMGCYAGEMFVDRLPAALPKLCAFVTVFTPLARPFEKLTIQVLKDERVVASLAASDIENSQAAVVSAAQGSSMLEGGPRRLSTRAVMLLAPFLIEASCTVSVRAETEEGVIEGSRLFIRQAPLPASGSPSS